MRIKIPSSKRLRITSLCLAVLLGIAFVLFWDRAQNPVTASIPTVSASAHTAANNTELRALEQSAMEVTVEPATSVFTAAAAEKIKDNKK
jgi:hypothetical protein